jgi:two-component system, OmpR family, phosphate regulon sensor histidine kinase PhoR
VFDRFSRSPDSPGAGLGLTIARTLVEAHGGRIRAESGPAGTTFVFSLPRGERER